MGSVGGRVNGGRDREDALRLENLGSSSWLPRPTRNVVTLAVLLNLVWAMVVRVPIACRYVAMPVFFHGYASEVSTDIGWTHYPKIGFTNLNLFHPSEATSPTIPRGLVMKDFIESVEAHPRYSASMWSDLEKNPDPDFPIVAFLDADLCFTVHWPKFGGNYTSSSDTENGRPPMPMRKDRFKNIDEGGVWTKNPCHLIDKALASPAITASPHSRLVVLSSEWHEGPIVSDCLGPNRNSSKYKQLVIGHVAQQFSQVNAQDFGIPPWPVKTVEDFPREKVCNESLPYLISFKGRARNFFGEFATYFRELAKQRKDIFIDFGTKHYTSLEIKDGGKMLGQAPKDVQAIETYYQLMTHSQFCPVPRGDNLFSVRFSEILSAGCIPIIYANGWVLPYTRVVVDWNELAVIIPQQNVHHTLDYIEQMTKEEICERRLLTYDFFQEYVKSGEARVSAIMKILDERLRTGRLDPFQYAPGISTHSASLKVYQLKPP